MRPQKTRRTRQVAGHGVAEVQSIPIGNSDQLHRWFFSKVKKSSGCWRWRGSFYSNGYGRVLHFKKVTLAHRFSYMIHSGAIPAGALFLHSCDNRWCVNPGHLRCGNQRENMRDLQQRGAPPRGERHGLSLLKECEVIEIRRLSRSIPQEKLAAMFGISRWSVRSIIERITWKHL